MEFWPTAAIRAALETDDLTVWQRIVVAIKRDPYGRTARQVEEVLEATRPYGVSKALSEVLEPHQGHTWRPTSAPRWPASPAAARAGPDSGQQEFASRIGVPAEELAGYLDGKTSPPASLMIRMRRLSDRFAKMKAHRAGGVSLSAQRELIGVTSSTSQRPPSLDNVIRRASTAVSGG